MSDKQEYYLAVCKDRHIDDQYGLFSKLEDAIVCCKEFMSGEEYIEEESDYYEYSASYGCEGDGVSVTRITLDK